MAFKASYNLLDKDTHNHLVDAFNTGGIGYTEADGTVHKISGDYVEGGSGGGYDAVIVISQGSGGTYTAEATSGSYSELSAKMASGEHVSIAVYSYGEDTYYEYAVGGPYLEYGYISLTTGLLGYLSTTINGDPAVLAAWSPCFYVSWGESSISVMAIN